MILLDEIEKAHPDVFNILLQVLEDGRLTDGQGRTVDFRNTVVIMTSNVGAESLKNDKRMGFNRAVDEAQDYARMKDTVMEKLKHTFRPEFLNRVDEVIVFQSLNETELKEIVELLLQDVAKRIKDNGYLLEISQAAKEYILKEGYDPSYGARPIKRAIQRLVEDTLSEEILKGTVEPGNNVLIDFEDGHIIVKKD